MKDRSYHQSAIAYNDALAEAAEEQVDKVEHNEVKKWCRSVGRQHRFHAKRHRSALAKMEELEAEERANKSALKTTEATETDPQQLELVFSNKTELDSPEDQLSDGKDV